MEQKVISMVNSWREFGLVRCIIDGNAIGFQLSETVKKACKIKGEKDIIDIIRGNMSIKFRAHGNKSVKKIPLNEFCHTQLKKYLLKERIELFKDQMQRMHFSGWDYNFKCAHTKEYGHGDIVDALSKCVLPDNYRKVMDEEKLDEEISNNTWEPKQEKKLHKPREYTIEEKLKIYKKVDLFEGMY
jgi:hypothetical protein